MTREEFLDRVRTGALDECWPWLGGRTGNYGRVPDGELAHRVAYRLLVGDPEGFNVHHYCDNHLCVNPLHLQLRTATEHGYLHGNEVIHRKSTDSPHSLPAGRPGW